MQCCDGSLLAAVGVVILWLTVKQLLGKHIGPPFGMKMPDSGCVFCVGWCCNFSVHLVDVSTKYFVETKKRYIMPNVWLTDKGCV